MVVVVARIVGRCVAVVSASHWLVGLLRLSVLVVGWRMAFESEPGCGVAVERASSSGEESDGKIFHHKFI